MFDILLHSYQLIAEYTNKYTITRSSLFIIRLEVSVPFYRPFSFNPFVKNILGEFRASGVVGSPYFTITCIEYNMPIPPSNISLLWYIVRYGSKSWIHMELG